MKESEVHTHPAMGAIRVSRMSVRPPMPAFGSDVLHGELLHVEVLHAEELRRLHQTDCMATDSIVDFYMTEYQWGQFLSSFGSHDGTPVTLQSIGYERVEKLPKPEDETTQFSREASEKLSTAVDHMKDVQGLLIDMMSGNPSKAKLRIVAGIVEKTLQDLNRNLPYVENCFMEAMESKVSEAKVELEAYVRNRMLHGKLVKDLNGPSLLGLPEVEDATE